MTHINSLQTTHTGSSRVVIGCVADNNAKYYSQALRLLQSVRWFGGSLADVDFIICFIDSTDHYYNSEFEKLGAIVRIAPRFSDVHGPSNKLCFFELPELSLYDTIIYLDCDTIITHDPILCINGTTFQAKIADGATVPHRIFKKLYAYYGIDIPPQKYKCSVTGDPTIWYCNTGVLIFPKTVLETFYPVWRKYTIDLNQNLALLEGASNFCEQAAMSLAFSAHTVPFTELPIAMNFPLHKPEPINYDAFVQCDPYIIHYHNRVTESGFIDGSPFFLAQKRVKAFNSRLRQYR